MRNGTKKLFLLLAICLLCAVLVVAFVACDDDGKTKSSDFKFAQLPDGTYEISDYTGTNNNCEIPSKYNGKPVTSIGNWAFNDTHLISVTIPDSVTNIGENAFAYIESLQTVKNGKNVTTIGFAAFTFCKNLQTVNLGEHLTSIGDSAFYVTGLTSATIPDSVTSIGKQAFSSCYSLQTLIISDNVTGIADDAFKGASLKTVTIPASAIGPVKSQYSLISTITITKGDIPNSAFQFANNLETVILGENVTSVGNRAFFGCTNIQSISLGNNVASIGDQAFEGCTALTNATMPANLISYIPQSNLSAVTITEGNISEEAFLNCASLQSITLHENVQSIGNSAFDGCNALTKVNYLGTLKSWCAIEFFCSPFNGNTRLYLNDVEVTEIKDLDGLNNIPNNAFYGLVNLTSVTIPDSVTNIGESAFEGCTGILSVTIGENVTTISNKAFFGCISLNTVYYAGTIEQRTAMSIGNNNSNLTDAYWFYSRHTA